MRLATLRIGKGPRATILTHGYLGSGRNLWSLARAWSERDPDRTFLLVDLTGHGQSPPLPPDASLKSIATDVLETAGAESLATPWDLVGHSMGGRVSLEALALAPDRVANIELLDIGPGEIGPAGDESTQIATVFARVPAQFERREDARAALDATGLSRPMVDWLLTNLVPRGSSFGWRVDRQALLRARLTINAGDLWGVVQRFGARIGCIRGDRSAYVSDADMERMRSLGCPVETLTGAGHFVHVDRPKELLEALLRRFPPRE